MKVKYAFLTTESAEPQAVQNYIAGYEANGGVWIGTISIDENISDSDLYGDYIDNLLSDGYELLLRNTSVSTTILDSFGDAVSEGLLAVFPSGLNFWHITSASPATKKNTMVFCGSGDREIGNATGIPCVFFDKAATESYQDILSIKQCGASYNIIAVMRVDENTLYIKLEGITDVTTVGIIEQGIPLYINNLSSELRPQIVNELVYTSNIIFDNEFFTISYSTTDGDFGVWYDATGSLQYGSVFADEVLIVRDGYNVDTQGSGISIKDITDFANNPNGTFEVSEYVNHDGFGNKIKINHLLGAGDYMGGGSMLFATQSYSTPYIAGQIAYIKDACGCDWYEAWGRALITASNYPDNDVNDGYGYLNVNDAIAWTDLSLSSTEIMLGVFTYNYGTETKIQTVTWNIVPFAEKYELWYRDELLITLDAHILKYQMNQFRGSKAIKNYLKIRAKRGDEYGEFSPQIELPFYHYKAAVVYGESV